MKSLVCVCGQVNTEMNSEQGRPGVFHGTMSSGSREGRASGRSVHFLPRVLFNLASLVRVAYMAFVYSGCFASVHLSVQ